MWGTGNGKKFSHLHFLKNHTSSVPAWTLVSKLLCALSLSWAFFFLIFVILMGPNTCANSSQTLARIHLHGGHLQEAFQDPPHLPDGMHLRLSVQGPVTMTAFTLHSSSAHPGNPLPVPGEQELPCSSPSSQCLAHSLVKQRQ